MSRFFNPSKRVKTRKEHVCEYCGKTILKGTSGVLYESGLFDGEFFARYACQTCQPHVGEFWDYVDGESYNIPCEFEEFMSDMHPEVKLKEEDDERAS